MERLRKVTVHKDPSGHDYLRGEVKKVTMVLDCMGAVKHRISVYVGMHGQFTAQRTCWATDRQGAIKQYEDLVIATMQPTWVKW